MTAPVQLHFATMEENVARQGTVLLREAAAWAWNRPRMICDLSDAAVAPDLSMPVIATHATYASRFERQFLFGFHHLHALVDPDGEFHCQELGNYRGRLERHVRNLPPPEYVIPDIRQRDDGFTVSLARLGPGRVEQLPGFTFFGTPIEPENWGMWLLNGLASAYSYVAAGQPGRYLCYADKAWQRTLLAYIGVSPERIVPQKPWQTYFCEQVALHQYSHVDLVPDEVTGAIFGDIVKRFCKGNGASGGEKLFVSRRSVTKESGDGHRGLVNEDELGRALQALGFTVIEPELLAFQQQVLLFHQAKAVVGLGGAGMFNTVFCKPGTRVISIEGSGAFALNHARLFAAAGLEYGFIFGRQNLADDRYPHNSWELDVPRAVQAVRSFT